ncbi:DUF3108 domain-containing protein [Rhizobium sp. AAP43]|uniref:DUF3108 domain-containing protein n=1 Tax=Rhizobium sp. AAP43 TaxID=1523420 RepID=UPI0006B937D7|nr:DUF3108 domain-containing protein [Rhizobium sp. AAP43]KPF45168.1 hypothetical protein IP76_08735 [Rhizobium sp. AAP43]
MKNSAAVIRLALGLALFGVSPPMGLAADARYESAYSVTLGILPIAQLTFRTTVDGDRYRIDGRFRATGLAEVVREVSAESRITGRLVGAGLSPERYTLDYRSGRKKSLYDVSFANGNVVDVKVEPKPRPRSARWVPVTAADLKSVMDPIGALLIPGNVDVCSQRLPVFDGESRMDLVLGPKRTETFSAGKVKGEAIVCSVRYEPRSGYRKGRKDIEYLKSVEGMEIWFAKTATLKLYAPVYAKIPTRYGTVHVSADTFDG